MGLDVADEKAPNYLRWIAELIHPHLGESVLEVGAGLGSITRLYANGRRVTATDVSAVCVTAMRQRFAGCSNVTAVEFDLRTEEDQLGTFDSVVLINVLEHIEDDVAVLTTLARKLNDDGRIIVYVPALNGLYGSWDRMVGHFRRYSKWRMRIIAREAGLDLAGLRYVNALAVPAWFAFSRTGVKDTQARSVSLWDRAGVPMTRALERYVQPPVGLNLLAVLRKAA